MKNVQKNLPTELYQINKISFFRSFASIVEGWFWWEMRVEPNGNSTSNVIRTKCFCFFVCFVLIEDWHFGLVDGVLTDKKQRTDFNSLEIHSLKLVLLRISLERAGRRRLIEILRFFWT